MTAAKREYPQARRLRRFAERMLQEKPSDPALSPLADYQRLIHELQVHQIELEMQNEELRHAKDEIEAGLHKYSELYDFAPMGYFTLDRRGKVLQANLKGAEMIGSERSLLVKVPFLNLVAPDHRLRFVEFLGKTLDSRLRHTTELELLGGGSVPFPARLEAVVLAGSAADETRCLVAVIDMTDLKLVQNEYERAKDAAQTSNRAKSSFLANMSHEIRTPISGVIGMMHLLGATDLDATQKHYAGLAGASAKQLLKLIDDVLDFSKIEAGKLEFSALEFSPRVVVEDCIDGLSYIAKEKGIRLVGHLDPAVPEFLVGDPHRFRQVLANLVGNALKFTGKGEVRVFMKAAPARSGECELEIVVSDTGVGIPAEKKDRLFKSFSQVDDSTARAYGGTGLGLAISKELVERMGGRITCRSEEGKGSIFSFTIRLEVPAASRAKDAAPLEKPGERPPLALEKLRILVAEDEPVNREVVVSYLQSMGCETTAVANGKSAVETFNSGHFDIVLMDVQMPRVDGFEATRLIREQEPAGKARVPIIGLTAHALKGDRDKCLSAGMDDYLTKPVEPKMLHETIRRWATTPQFSQTPKPGPAGTVYSGVLQKIGPARRDELLHSLLSGLDEGRGKLREGLSKGDFGEVSFWAHRMRGSLMALGFDAAAAIAGEIEMLSTKSLREGIDDLLEKLDEKVQEVKALISSGHAE